MDGVLLQSKVYGGYAKAALRVGLDFDLYRPTSATNPLAIGNKLLTLKAAFTVHSGSDFNFSKPSDYKGPMFHALLDGTQVKVGDYLKSSVSPDGPFFIIGADPIVPILAVQSNRTVSVFKPDDAAGSGSRPIGVSGYGGTIATTANANEYAVMTGWPASVLEGSRGMTGGALPIDAEMPLWRILMPAWAGVLINPGYVIQDDANKRMIVKQAELSNLGWNIQAVQALV